MKLARTTIFRSVPLPALQQVTRVQPIQTRFASTDPASKDSVGDKGTSKVYNQDGTNPNKNLIYLGLGAIGLGAMYAMFMSKPGAVAGKAKEGDPEGVARQRAANSPPAR
ncbi:hypothetical protein C8A03DRAFT_15692 [Achaetomium macrosporum]|uniref:Uncharacterized protein n=1 Tax=Achaetomium macrosporum TaxID=79813 RepID=A0AAN7CA73_9PEZI|nr:hypothetical protein C8A03DRAFT_15692 [Achaetomium macrosporum]